MLNVELFEDPDGLAADKPFVYYESIYKKEI